LVGFFDTTFKHRSWRGTLNNSLGLEHFHKPKTNVLMNKRIKFLVKKEIIFIFDVQKYPHYAQTQEKYIEGKVYYIENGIY